MAQRKKASISNYLNIDPIPLPGQVIARVIAPKGGNLHQVELPDNSITLAELPPKYRNVIWVKRDSYVVVQPINHKESVTIKPPKIGAEICTVLNAKHVAQLQNLGLFPGQWITGLDDKINTVISDAENLSDCSSLGMNPNGPCRAYDSDSSVDNDHY